MGYKIIQFANEEEWLEFRKGRITGTLAGLFAKRDWKGIVKKWNASVPPSNVMLVGKYLEPMVIAKLDGVTPVPKNTIYVCEDAPYLAASPDALGKDCIVEIKTTRSLKVPTKNYFAQAAFYAWILGYKKAIIALFDVVTCEDPQIFEVPDIDNYFRLFEEAKEEIQNGRAGFQVDFRDSGRLYPLDNLALAASSHSSVAENDSFDVSDSEPLIEQDPSSTELQSLIEQLYLIRSQVKALQQGEKEIAEAIKQKLGTRTVKQRIGDYWLDYSITVVPKYEIPVDVKEQYRVGESQYARISVKACEI